MVQLHLTLPAAPGVAAFFVAGERAVAEVLVVGVEGLVARLELELGIPPPPTTSERTLSLLRDAPRVSSHDPVAEVRETLRLADALRAELVGVAMLPPRLRVPLAGAMQCAGSLADRVDHIIARLDRAPSLSIVAHAAQTRWPGVVQKLLAALERRGTIISWAPEPAAEARPLRIVIVRGPTGSTVATRVVEGVVAAGGEPVWIAPDSVVDHAFASRGLPLFGARSGSHPAESIVGCVIALAFHPRDPRDALELLDAPCCPLPRSLARSLCRALQEWPSWQSAAWQEACRGACDESGDAPPALAWLLSCLEPLAACDGELPVDLFSPRIAALGDIAVAVTSPFADDLAALCARFVAKLRALGSVALDRATLDGLASLAEADLPADSNGVAQVGALSVPALSALIHTAEHLVVWNAATPPSDPFAALLPKERAALRAAGATVTDRSTQIAQWHGDLLRAMAMTRGTVWLCLPDLDARGARIEPPSWEGALEVWASAGGPIVREDFEAPRVTVARRSPPRARAVWSVAPELVPPRWRESPSSVTTALGCPLRHALRYHAALDEPFAPTLPDGGLLYGRLAHALFEAVWSTVPETPDPAVIAERIGRRFDDELPSRALSLTLPEARARSAAVRETIVRAGEALAYALHRDGVRVTGCEVSLGDHRRLGGVRWSGRADMVLGPAPMVLDLKWSGALHRAALADGSAVQLALYAWMLRGRDNTAPEPPWPAVGYLIATTATLYATPNAPLRSAVTVAGPPLAATVSAVARRLEALSEARSRGELRAPGVDAPELRSGLRDGALETEAPCRNCAYSMLCGRGLSP